MTLTESIEYEMRINPPEMFGYYETKLDKAVQIVSKIAISVGVSFDEVSNTLLRLGKIDVAETAYKLNRMLKYLKK